MRARATVAGQTIEGDSDFVLEVAALAWARFGPGNVRAAGSFIIPDWLVVLVEAVVHAGRASS